MTRDERPRFVRGLAVGALLAIPTWGLILLGLAHLTGLLS